MDVVRPGTAVRLRDRERGCSIDHRLPLRARVSDVDHWAEKASALQEQGQTVVFVGIDDRTAGIVAIADALKDSTPAALAHLHRMGISIIMLTGDNERTARAIAEKLGIDHFEAEV